MPDYRLFNHMQTDKCNKVTERIIRQRHVEMAAKCGEMEFRL